MSSTRLAYDVRSALTGRPVVIDVAAEQAESEAERLRREATTPVNPGSATVVGHHDGAVTTYEVVEYEREVTDA